MDGMTPVSVMFNQEGIIVTSLKKEAGYQKTISWKELYRIGLKGKRLSAKGALKGVVKQLTEKAHEVIKENEKRAEQHKRFMKDMKSLPKPMLPPRPMMPPSPPPPAPPGAALP